MSIGESLADARRQAGLTVTQVSQQTRVRESIIRDIEQGDFSACGGDFYARGHIRSIAGVVGTDPVPLISEYDADHGATMGQLRASDVFEPSRPIKIRERRSPSMTRIVIVVLLVVSEAISSTVPSPYMDMGIRPMIPATEKRQARGIANTSAYGAINPCGSLTSRSAPPAPVIARLPAKNLSRT